MSEHIKREDALVAVLFALVGTGHQSKAIYAIRDIPTADAVEVRHAYWKETTHITVSRNFREIHSKLYNCSYCDAPNGRKKSSYCHWCGAKMDGERKEEQ